MAALRRLVRRLAIASGTNDENIDAKPRADIWRGEAAQREKEGFP
jgi:hypothetical protein